MLPFKDCLFLIPARAGSKGLPGKNTRILDGKPLISYSIEFTRLFVPDDQICVSTNDQAVTEVCAKANLPLLFRRPDALATDTASSRDVMVHALDFYQEQGLEWKHVVLLQPTSPFRKKAHLEEMAQLWESGLDLLVSVKKPKDHPHFSMFAENDQGLLQPCLATDIHRRQDAPPVYAFNGSMYIFSADYLRSSRNYGQAQMKKFLMEDPVLSVDIDGPMDWLWAEFIRERGLYTGF